jgi:SAM-dependent methyltransferase
MGKKKVDTKEIGLDIGLIIFKFFLKTEYMHYGYWVNGLEVDITNMGQAQKQYTDMLMGSIPAGVKTILDVGCGSGKVAEDLLEKGYQVDCVSPASRLTSRAVERLKGKSDVVEKKFEDFHKDKRYDLILFSESFQYIQLDRVFDKAIQHLNPGGHLLLCDFFQTDAPGKSPLGGGHPLKAFYDTLQQQPFTVVDDTDITRDIAPTMTLINRLTMEVIHPVWQMLFELLTIKYPRITRFLKWKYKAKIEKNENKHFKGERNADNFIKYKSYRRILLKWDAKG